MSALASAGTIGLHMVSGPIVGFLIGYALDSFLNIHPWGKIVFLVIGILAGFLNVYIDTTLLLKKMAKEDKTPSTQKSPKASTKTTQVGPKP